MGLLNSYEKLAYKKYSIYLLLSLLITLAGTVLGNNLNSRAVRPFIFISIALFLLFMFSKGIFKKIIFFIFCFGEGLALTPILYHYTKTSIATCMLLVLITTAICLVIGLKAKDLSFLGGILFGGLICLLLYGILGIFISLPPLSLIGALIFSAYISFDINRFKRNANSISEDEILDEVMSMYLNILNLLLYILRLFGNDN